jgi:photosystem II stability/assembly factor-like uncharacterized protein
VDAIIREVTALGRARWGGAIGMAIAVMLACTGCGSGVAGRRPNAAPGNGLVQSIAGRVTLARDRVGVPVEPTAVGFFTPRRGVIVVRGRLMVTDDGGRSWRPLGQLALTSIDVVSRSVAFGDTLDGLWRTADAGVRWRRVAPMAGALSFADSLHGWLITGVAQLEATTDGGRSFTRLRMPKDCGAGGYSLAASLVSTRFGYLACGFEPGAGSQEKLMYLTRDGGRTWHPDPGARLGEGGYLAGISFWTARDGLLYLARGGILVTHDGGRTWRDVLGTDDITDVVAFQHVSDDVIALLEDGSIVRVSEHGGPFHTLYPRTLPRPTEVSFSSPEDAIGIGDANPSVLGQPGVLTTDDGGRTWHVRNPISDLSKLVRVSPSVVYAIAINDQSFRTALMRTDNDGRTWHPVVLPRARATSTGRSPSRAPGTACSAT